MSGSGYYFALQFYPAVLLQYSAGIGAAASGRLDTVHSILTKPRIRGENERYLSVDLFNQLNNDLFKILPELEKRSLARSERICSALREPIKAIVPGDAEYIEAFDLFETLQSLESANSIGWAMPGQFMYRYYLMRGGKRMLRRDGAPVLAFREQIKEFGDASPLLKAGFLNGSVKAWESAAKLIDEMTEKFH
jgi:hypothetical protein